MTNQKGQNMNTYTLNMYEGRVPVTACRRRFWPLATALTVLWWSVAAHFCLGSPAIPPGVPEPGLILWGAVVNATNPAQALAISTGSWSVTDGTKTAVYSSQTRPATRIVTL